MPNGTWPDMRDFATGAMQFAVTPYFVMPAAALRTSDTMPPFAAQ